MSEQRKGSVVYDGPSGMQCPEAAPYSATGTLLERGQVLEEIPEKTLKRFLSTLQFKPNDDVAEALEKELLSADAIRVNGAIVEAQTSSSPKFSAMNVENLKAIAQEVGIADYASMKKAELVAALEASENPEPVDPLRGTTESKGPGPDAPVEHKLPNEGNPPEEENEEGGEG